MADSTTATKAQGKKFRLVTSLPSKPTRQGRPAAQEVLDYMEGLKDATEKKQVIQVAIDDKEKQLAKERNWIRQAGKKLGIEVSQGFWADDKDPNKGQLFAGEKSVYKDRVGQAKAS